MTKIAKDTAKGAGKDAGKGATQANGTEKRCYFIARITSSIRIDDTTARAHSMNLIADFPSPHIPRSGLESMQRQVLRRLHETGICEPENVIDILFDAINLLGYMTPDEFHDRTEVSSPGQSQETH